jgi:SAM-dependent methyltransferase
MTTRAALRSARSVFGLALDHLVAPERYLIDRRVLDLDKDLGDPQNWDEYWNKSAGKSGIVYDLIAAFYRQTFIRRNLEKAIIREFSGGSKLLHAGCGSGQVDRNLQSTMQITALDISRGALRLYSRNNPVASRVVHGDIMKLPFGESEFNGYYSLGVVEHFTKEQIQRIFTEAKRVLKPGGKIVIFWPHYRATSVIVLGVWHWILRNILQSDTILHPPEISLVCSRKMAEEALRGSGLKMESYTFGLSDLFIQAVVVASK